MLFVSEFPAGFDVDRQVLILFGWFIFVFGRFGDVLAGSLLFFAQFGDIFGRSSHIVAASSDSFLAGSTCV